MNTPRKAAHCLSGGCCVFNVSMLMLVVVVVTEEGERARGGGHLHPQYLC
jgi:hypothetical protein